MENRGLFWLVSFCLLLCAVPSRTQQLFQPTVETNETGDRISDREKNNENASDSKIGQIDWTRDENFSTRGIDGNKPGCSRYCVKRRIDGVIDPARRINIIWKILDDPRTTFTVEPSAIRVGSSTPESDFLGESVISSTTGIFDHEDRKCELHIEIGCESLGHSTTSANSLPGETSDRHERTLAATDHARGYTETEFTVGEATGELRISVLGKLSRAILEIPAGTTDDARTPRATLSLSRTSDGRGTRLDARNPPSGGWRLRLLGVANSNYSLDVVAASAKTPAGDSSVSSVFATATTRSGDSPRPTEKSSTSSRSLHLKISGVDAGTIKSHDQQTLDGRLSAGEPEVSQLSASGDSSAKPEGRDSTGRESPRKFPRAANLEVEVMKPGTSDKIVTGGSSDDPAKITEDTELEELSRSVGEVQTRTRKTVVEISPNAQLIAKPPFHDVVFTVTNNQPLGIRHVFQGRSTVFPFVGILPANALWIRSGETVEVAVRIRVTETQDSSPGVVTLYVGGNENFEVAEKSTYVYVQGPNGLTTTDTDKPSIDYAFNDNCNGKLNRDRCNKSLWSVEVTVKDSDSGLKSVTSLPKGLEPRTEFIAGTKNSVTFYYVSTCCYTTVDVKATDVQGNTYTRTVDVTEWDNLTQGEIAAIVVGALLILLLIVLIILLAVYCVRRRKSHDLSYSQRYGSRTPASTERTNF